MSGRAVLIDAQRVSRVFAKGGDEVHALRDVSVQVYQGEYLALMGPSGSGKSTFFNMVGGLDFPTGGTITVGGMDLKRLDADRLAYLRGRYIGYIFQNYNLIEVVSARDNVVLPMLLAGTPPDAARARAEKLLGEVGLGHRLDHLPGKLSGGQQQRVAIARALANQPQLILADEPTANLDSKTGVQIIELLAQLCRSHGVTVVSATHDAEMLKVCDRVIHLHAGSVSRVELRSEMEIRGGSIS